VKSYIFLAALSVTSLSASYEDYELYEKSDTMTTYFVKIGAFSDLKDATRLETKSALFDTQVINMQKYYSVVSQGFRTIKEASAYLVKVKKHYQDAYLFSLYKNQEIKVVMPKVVPKVLTSYDEGVAHYKAKRFEEALASFDRALIDDENDLNSRFYYAKTLYELKIFNESKIEFSKLLGSALSENDKLEVKNYLDAISSNTKRSFFNVEVSLGAGYDDNIDLTTDEKITKYGNYLLENNTDKKESTYGSATLALSHRYNGSFVDVVSSLYSYNEFAHTADGNDFNYLDLKIALQKRYDDFLISMPIGANIAYIDSDEIGYNIYTSPSFRYYINENFITSLESTYLDNSSKYMKGKDYTMLGVNGGLIYKNKSFESGLFGGVNQFDAKKNLRFDVDKDVINTNIYSYYTFYKNYVGINGSYAKEDFNRLDSALGYKREDKILRYGLSVGRNIDKHFATSLGFKHTTNESNINVYTYDKNNYIFDVKYRF